MVNYDLRLSKSPLVNSKGLFFCFNVKYQEIKESVAKRVHFNRQDALNSIYYLWNE